VSKKGGHIVSKKKVMFRVVSKEAAIEPTVGSAVGPTVEPTVEPINHMLEAQVRVDELRAMRQVIPNFTIPTSLDATRLSSAASLPPEFVQTAALAMRNSQAVARVDGVSAFAIRDWMSFAEAYAGVADENEANAQFMKVTGPTASLIRRTSGKRVFGTWVTDRHPRRCS
jgi:hypothetical protein